MSHTEAKSPRFRQGEATRRTVLSDAHVERSQAAMTDFDAPFQVLITEAAWGHLWSREQWSKRDRSIVTIALLAGLGHYEEMEPERRELLSGMKSIHRMDVRLVKDGKAPPQAIHPVFVTHPRTGRKCLFVNEGRSVAFVGMDEAESRPLLNNLLDRLKEPERMYRHKWQVGDLLMWDNIAVQHHATHDYAWPEHRRLMHRTTVKGVPLC